MEFSSLAASEFIILTTCSHCENLIKMMTFRIHCMYRKYGSWTLESIIKSGKPSGIASETSAQGQGNQSQWRHNSVSNHQPLDCLLNRLFRRRSKKTSKLRVTGLCAGNSPGTGEFPAQMASYAENVSIWWRYHAHELCPCICVAICQRLCVWLSAWSWVLHWNGNVAILAKQLSLATPKVVPLTTSGAASSSKWHFHFSAGPRRPWLVTKPEHVSAEYGHWQNATVVKMVL